MHGILSLVKNLLCACPGQIPRYSGLEYQSYYFALLKKLYNTCPLKLLLHRGGAKLEYLQDQRNIFGKPIDLCF
jgi:hypothetical protein